MSVFAGAPEGKPLKLSLSVTDSTPALMLLAATVLRLGVNGWTWVTSFVAPGGEFAE